MPPGAGKVLVATDDGSAGYHGFCTDPAAELLTAGGYDYVATCGPSPMMKKVAASGATPACFARRLSNAWMDLRLRRLRHVRRRDRRRHEGCLHVRSCF